MSTLQEMQVDVGRRTRSGEPSGPSPATSRTVATPDDDPRFERLVIGMGAMVWIVFLAGVVVSLL